MIRLKPTIELASSALLFACFSGLSLGIVGSFKIPFGVHYLAQTLTNLALSVPIFWTASLALSLAALQQQGFAFSETNTFTKLLLPALILGFHSGAAISRLTYNSITDIKSAPYIQTAYAKGLSKIRVINVHILRIGLLPIISVIALQAGFLFSGTVIIEGIFVRSGLGRLMLDATLQHDYPVVQAFVMLLAVAYVLFNLLADILHRLMDPRVSL